MAVRRAFPLSLLVALALPAAPAAGADQTVQAVDFEFRPATVRIDPGDTVTWTFAGDPHTVTADSGQTLAFDSGLREAGAEPFSQMFARRGRFTYVCEVHQGMEGVVEVGPAPFPDTLLPRIGRLRARGSVLSFRLSEGATVRAVVTRGGRRVKSVRRRLGKGAGRLALKGLRPGRYRATLTATDRAKNRGRAATIDFRVR